MKNQTALEFVKRAVGKDDHRPILQNVAYQRIGDEYFAVATDTHRLHVCKVEDPPGTLEPGACSVVNFPSWERVVPKEYTRRVFVQPCKFYAALKAFSALCKPQANRVILTIGEDLLRLETRSSDCWDASANLPRVDYEGNGPIQIAFNVKYLMDALAPLADKKLTERCDIIKVAFELTENTRPMVILHEDYKAVIMPMALA